MFTTFLLWNLVTPRQEYSQHYVHDFPVVESCSSRDVKARVFTTPFLARAFILLSKGSRHSFPGSLAILPNRFHPPSLPSIHCTHVVDFREDI